DAARQQGKLGQIKIVGFDEDEATLDGVAAGHVHGAVVQRPEEMGAQTVRLLALLGADPKAELPKEVKAGVLTVPERVVRKADVADSRKDLGARRAARPAPAEGRFKVGVVTNNPADFWKLFEAGAARAATEARVELLIRRPELGDPALQEKLIDGL